MIRTGTITFRKCCNCEGSPKEVKAAVQLSVDHRGTIYGNNYKQQGYSYPICGVCRFPYHKVNDTEGTNVIGAGETR